MRFKQNSSRYRREKGEQLDPSFNASLYLCPDNIIGPNSLEARFGRISRFYFHVNSIELNTINSTPWYGDTPVGFYGFPMIESLWSDFLNGKLYFANNKKNVVIFELTQPKRCLLIDGVQANQIYSEIKQRLPGKALTKEEAESGSDVPDPIRARFLRRLLVETGFTSIASFGGQIHPNEPKQAVALTLDSFKVVGSWDLIGVKRISVPEFKSSQSSRDWYPEIRDSWHIPGTSEIAESGRKKEVKFSDLGEHGFPFGHHGVDHEIVLGERVGYHLENQEILGYLADTSFHGKKVKHTTVFWINYRFPMEQLVAFAKRMKTKGITVYFDHKVDIDKAIRKYMEDWQGVSRIEEQEDEDHFMQDEFLPKRKGKLKKEGLIRHALYNPAPKAVKFSLFDLTQGQRADLYEVFASSYTQATGNAWSNSLFNRRAGNWTFYGLIDGPRTGVIAIRTQNSGLNKLVAIAGHPRSALAGIKLLMTDKQNEPIWGMISADLVPTAKRMGLLTAHDQAGGPAFMRAVLSMIPAEVFGDSQIELLPDGGISVNVAEVGTVTKYLVFNTVYLQTLVKQALFMLPAAVPIIQTFTAKLMFGGK